MVFKAKFLELPRELVGIIEAKNDPSNDKPTDFETTNYNKKNYLSSFSRLIDPVILCLFYGLYDSKKLPDTSNSYNTDFIKKEFNVDISRDMHIFNHLLFCLWLKENGFPNEAQNIGNYRKELYSFLGMLLNQDEVSSRIIPFYLAQAVKSDSNFVYEMRETTFLEPKVTVNSPEYLAMTFKAAQEEFEDTIIKPLFDKITPSQDQFMNLDNFEIELKQLILKGESGYREFKSSALWSKNIPKDEIKKSTSSELRNFGQNASKFIIARALCSFLNTDGGNLVIGIKENKETGEDEIIGVNSEYNKIKDKNADGYRRMIIDDIIRNYFDGDIYNNATKYLNISFPEIENKTLCWIQVKKSDKPVFIKANKKEMFFIRTDAETREIEGKEMTDYCKVNFA